MLAAAGLRAATAAPEPDLATFRRDIEPVLARACYRCHGPDEQKGDVRIDALAPDLFGDSDVDWWLDVLAVLTNGEMRAESESMHGTTAASPRRVVETWHRTVAFVEEVPGTVPTTGGS